MRIRGMTPGTRSSAVSLDEWDRAVTAMLQAAVTYGELDDRLQRQRAWLAANGDDERFVSRNRTMHRTFLERNQAAIRMMDLAERVSALHRVLPPGSRDGLAALVGHELWPYCPNRWALTAARMKSTDIFDVAFHVLADRRAEEEAA